MKSWEVVLTDTLSTITGYSGYIKYLFNVHRYNTFENNITNANSMPLTGDNSTMVASMQVT